MKSFIQRFASVVVGVLAGWDRLRLRGTIRGLAHHGGMFGFLWHRGVLLQDFGRFADDTTKRIRTATEALVREQDRPLIYLPKSTTSKDDFRHLF